MNPSKCCFINFISFDSLLNCLTKESETFIKVILLPFISILFLFPVLKSAHQSVHNSTIQLFYKAKARSI